MFQKHEFKILQIMEQHLWSLAEVKNYLRLSHNYDDSLLEDIIKAAVTAAEDFIGLSILAKEIRFTSNLKYRQKFTLKYRPLLNITKMTLRYIEREEELQPEQYYVNNDRCIVNLVRPLIGEELIMEYIAGFDEKEIPPSIKHGILLHIAEMYDREQVINELLPAEVRNLYLPYRQLKV